MHLRSVTLRGFKSFADRTKIEFEPGLICVVGPNGAGKSNLIDALVWAMGTLSARALRADRMEDVIFTGTVSRPALGMANVVLTFDNASGEFPIEFAEVSLGRTLYRDGASEYELNGTTCRLLDLQDLLSEAGIGRELHAVVAQGQVDDIVASRPEELRSFVEEAAGISKHRRRKERALRKIENVDADIDRAADLVREQARQLRPLKAQAAQALRHREVTDRLREIRIRLVVGELEGAHRERERAMTARASSADELATLRTDLDAARTARLEAEQRLDDVRREASGLRRGLEHLRSAQAAALRSVVVLRERVHARPDVRRRDAIVAKRNLLDVQSAEVRRELDAINARIAESESRSAGLRESRHAAADEATRTEHELHAVRDELVAIEAEMRAAEQEAIGARADANVAGERFDGASERIARISQQATVVRTEIERLDADGGRQNLTVTRLTEERTAAMAAAEEALGKLRTIEKEAATLTGRAESLRVARDLTVSRRQGAEALAHAHGVALGARGVLGDAIRVASGLERAVEAALGPALDALVVAAANLSTAVERAEQGGHDAVVVPTLAAGPRRQAPDGARALSEVVEADGWVRGTVDALLDGVYLVDDWTTATRLAADRPEATFVTPQGRLLRARGLSRPARGAEQAALGIAQALERTEEGLRRLDADRGRWSTNRDRRTKEVARLDGELDEARSALHEIEGRIAAAADRLRELGAEEHGASLERDLAAADREERLHRAEAATARREQLAGRDGALRERESDLAGRVTAARQRADAVETEMRSVAETLGEMLQTRASLAERLRGVEQAREELTAEEAEADAPPTAPEDLTAAEEMLSSLDALVSRTEAATRELLEREEAVEDDLRTVSSEASRLEVAVATHEPRQLQAAEAVTRLDVQIEELGSRLAREYDLPPSQARAEFPLDAEPEALKVEERRLDAELRRMGPVNPLAADEIVSLEERKAFLEAQLEDLRSSKRDLFKLIRQTEEKMRELLSAAVDDADGRFGEVIGLLFPEGGGRLRLAGSEDVLEAGLELEVKLGRKGHRKLSFLSGGEKALAGLGFLFALHLARPTPFLVLDEVDAPLDDANLGRFLRLLDSLRTRTQVIVVTHQKRTMQRADTLLGVTLNPDGSTRVLVEDLREAQVQLT